ncbi:hypothetical protein ACP4OV_025347 [Aristida adscensionis]
MEHLFMQLFEPLDSLAAQVQQQQDSFAQTLACALLAAGHRPPDWLLPSRAAGPQDLNGKSVVPDLVFTGSRITTPAVNRTIFLPPAVPSTSTRELELPNGYTLPDTNCAALDTDQHEEAQQEQTSLSQELAKTCSGANMFSRIQRSKSRQRYIEDRLHASDQTAKSGSCDGMQDQVHRSKLVDAGSDKTTASSPSIPSGDVTNNAETTSSRPGEENVFSAGQGRSTDFMKCNSGLGNQGVQLDPSLSLALESKIVRADSDAEVGNYSSIRDLPNMPLRDHSRLNVADTVSHIMPESYMLVEPRKLQFDGGEPVCMDTASEQTGQQQGPALESNHLDLNCRSPLSEDPYPTNSSREQQSIAGSMLAGFKSEGVRDQAAKSGSCDGMQDQVHTSKLVDIGSDQTTVSSPSIPCGDVVNNAEITSSCPGQGNVFYASQGMPTDFVKCNRDLGNQRFQLDPSPTLAQDLKILYDDSDAEVGNYCSSGDLPNMPLPDHSGLNVADTMCHIMPETHLLVEPKELQFDGGESVCMDTDSEQTGQQQGSALESNRLDLNGRNPFSEGPYPTSSQDPHSIGRSMLDGFKSEDLRIQAAESGSAHGMQDRMHRSKLVDVESDKNTDDGSEQTGQQQGSALESNHLDLNGRNPSSEDPYPTNTSQDPDSIGRSMLDGFKSQDLRDRAARSGSAHGMQDRVHRSKLVDVESDKNTASTPSTPCGDVANSAETTSTRPGQENSVKSESMVLQGLSTTISSVEQRKTNLQMDEMSSQSVMLNPEIFSGTSSLTVFPSYALDQYGKHVSDPITSIHEKFSYGSSVERDTKLKSEDPMGFLLSGDTIPSQEGDEFVDCNSTMPEFECFDVSVPSDCPTTERTYEVHSDITNKANTLSGMHQQVTTMSEKSTNYLFHGDASEYSESDDDSMMDILSDTTNKANTLSSMHQQVTTISDKATNYLFHSDASQYSESDDDSMMDIFASCGLGISDSFAASDVVASFSSVSNKQESGEKPLTPAVEKYSLGKLSAKVGSISEHMGSIPELSCFRIDEDSDMAEEKEYQVLPESVGDQQHSGRKALNDITGLCQNTENPAFYSIGFMDTGTTGLTTETCSSELKHHSDLMNDCDNKKSREHSASLVKRKGKVSHSLHNRSSKKEVIDNRNQRNTSEANLGKRSKPSNIIANVASFIPLVKPKVPSTTACVKKDIRVKALEAAEAAKRLEEKKRNEREMRKAAAKLEREKLKQEKELKQRQEQEQKKKRDTDMATKKRQRDEEEKREKDRKRRCVEEARKQQKQPMERRHANAEKDAHPKVSDNKELRKNLAEAVKGQVKPFETADLGNKAVQSNNDKVMIVDERPANSGSLVKENIPNNPEESYMMSPFKDSDEEDEEHEEQSRRRRKLVPSWAEKGNLDIILLSNRTLDSTAITEIFTRKCSFNLDHVLPAHATRRGPN